MNYLARADRALRSGATTNVRNQPSNQQKLRQLSFPEGKVARTWPAANWPRRGGRVSARGRSRVQIGEATDPGRRQISPPHQCVKRATAAPSSSISRPRARNAPPTTVGNGIQRIGPRTGQMNNPFQVKSTCPLFSAKNKKPLEQIVMVKPKNKRLVRTPPTPPVREIVGPLRPEFLSARPT